MLSVVIEPNRYQDSVVLMALSRQLSDLPGVTKASVMMGTPANLQILADTGFADPGLDTARPGDMVIAVEADDEAVASEAVRHVGELLAGQAAKSRRSHLPRARTLDVALAKLPSANFAFVSVPGAYVGELATTLLDRGLHTMIFSDNVPLDDEIRLKGIGAERGLFVLGPDCGTSVIGGVALGFANVIRSGGVGIAGASGTGTQEIMSQIDRLGGGCSNVLGLGGRDLSAEVGGVACTMALQALDADPATSVIVLVTKPPARAVRDTVEQVAQGLDTPVVALFLGENPATPRDGNLWYAHTCAEAAELAVELDGVHPSGLRRGQRGIRGFYTGGTLASEAAMLIGEAFGLSLPQTHDRGIMLDAGGHRVIDLGDDVYTQGRPHPMIDPSSRADVLPAAFDDPNTGVVLLDVVLGYGSSDDPAGALVAPVTEGVARAAAAGRTVRVVASLCGTAGDPQGYQEQRDKLVAAGVHVLPSNAAAVRHAIALAQDEDARPDSTAVQSPASGLLAGSPSVINIGLPSFAEAMAATGASVVQYDWAPPAGGDERLARLLRGLATA